MEGANKKSFFENPITRTKITSANVKFKELLFGYFVGPFGALLASGIFSGWLNYYFTDILFAGVSGNSAVTTFATLLPLLSTILIVAGNLVMGQLIERTKSKAGKARPWILLSAVTMTVACILIFVVPFENVVAKMVWYAVAYNLFYSVAYPMYNTANSTLIPVSTRNSKQRGLLASANNVAALAVMGAGTMIFPSLVSVLLKTQIQWTIAFICVGILCFFACILQYYFTRERVTEEGLKLNLKQEKVPVIKQLKAVATDKYWWLIILFYLLFQFSGAMKNTSMAYFCQWIVDSSFWTNMLGLTGDAAAGAWGYTNTLLAVLGALPMAVAMLIVWPLSNKFGKKNVTLIGMLVGVAGGIVAIVGGENIVPVGIGVALKCLGSAPACYMILAMLSDTLDHIEAKHGYRCDGLTMSIYSSIMAAATGFCSAIFNAMIGVGSTYDSSLAVQPGSVQTAISVAYLWVETIAYAVCALLLLFFTVEKFRKKDREQIIARQKMAVLEQGGTWIDPEERLRMEQEEADRLAEQARIDELKARCDRKGLDFEKIEAEYQKKRAKKLLRSEKKNKLQ